MKLFTCMQRGWERQNNHLALLETEANKEINGVRRRGLFMVRKSMVHRYSRLLNTRDLDTEAVDRCSVNGVCMMNARQRPLSYGFCRTYSVQVQINIDSKLQMIHLSQMFQETNARSQPALSVCPLDTMDLLGDRYYTSERCRTPGVFRLRPF